MEGQLLIVEDSPADYENYIRLLETEAHPFTDVIHANSIKEAKAYLENHNPDCCILDYQLQEKSAKDLLSELNKNGEEPQFPIVVATGHGSEMIAAELMQMGIQEYLSKGVLTSPTLMAALNKAIENFQLKKKVQHLAHYDGLTGLLNRSLFLDRLEQALGESKRYNRHFCVIYLDLDHFKHINDTYGHDIGDRVLKAAAKRIRKSVRSTDSVARFGGDEFVILMPESDSHDAHFVCQKIMKNMPQNIETDSGPINIAPSIGFTTYTGSSSTTSRELLKQADTALYQAKAMGRNQYIKYSDDEDAPWKRKEKLFRHLPTDILDNKLTLAYQPIVDAHTGQLFSVEALTRWNLNGEWIPPLEIVDLIHEGSFSPIFHEWLFNNSLKEFKHWQIQNPQLKLAINIPADQCYNQLIIDKLLSYMAENDIPPQNIIVEITETHFMKYARAAQNRLIELNDLGINLAIDDFGTGYSSMEYLADLPFKELKIDQRFFQDWSKNPKNKKIAKAISALGRSLDLEIVAEGVSDDQIVGYTEVIKSNYNQGYWYGAPVFFVEDLNEFQKQSKIKGHLS